MSSLALKLPNNYVEIERDEMEYVDGGAQKVDYWWGWAVDLSPTECATMATLLDANIAGGAGVGTIGAIIAGSFPAVGVPMALAAVVYGVGVGYAKATLSGCASAGKGATLCKNLTGYHVNVW